MSTTGATQPTSQLSYHSQWLPRLLIAQENTHRPRRPRLFIEEKLSKSQVAVGAGAPGDQVVGVPRAHDPQAGQVALTEVQLTLLLIVTRRAKHPLPATGHTGVVCGLDRQGIDLGRKAVLMMRSQRGVQGLTCHPRAGPREHWPDSSKRAKLLRLQ